MVQSSKRRIRFLITKGSEAFYSREFLSHPIALYMKATGLYVLWMLLRILSLPPLGIFWLTSLFILVMQYFFSPCNGNWTQRYSWVASSTLISLFLCFLSFCLSVYPSVWDKILLSFSGELEFVILLSQPLRMLELQAVSSNPALFWSDENTWRWHRGDSYGTIYTINYWTIYFRSVIPALGGTEAGRYKFKLKEI